MQGKEVVSAWEMPFFSAVHLLISRDVLVTSGAWGGLGGLLPSDVEYKRQTVATCQGSSLHGTNHFVDLQKILIVLWRSLWTENQSTAMPSQAFIITRFVALC